jgi:hypothetical protein
MAPDARRVIKAETASGASFPIRLAARAAQIAAAAAEARLLARRGDPLRWRRARLLWPLFAKDR